MRVPSDVISRVAVFGMLCGVALFVFVVPTYANDDSQISAITSDHVIQFINEERIAHGVSPLAQQEALITVAQKKLADMMEDGYFAHTAPDGTDAWAWFLQAGYDFSYAGENLATGFTDAQSQHTAWMESPAHRQNILDERFTHTGVAVGRQVQGDREVIITVEVFATPKKVVMTSPNFTPQTFEVPEELIPIEQNRKEAVLHGGMGDYGHLLARAGVVSPVGISGGDALQDRPSHHAFAWGAVGLIVVLVLVAEYYLFAKRRA